MAALMRAGRETAGRAARRGGRGLSLSFVILRYFAYAFVALVLVWGLAFAVLGVAINIGAVLPANYGSAHMRETAERLRETGDVSAAPTVFRRVLIDPDEGLVETDLAGDDLARVRENTEAQIRSAIADGPGSGRVDVFGASQSTYGVFWLDDDTVCVLVSQFMPEFASPALAAALPNPQNIMLAGGVLGSAACIALIAVRASRVITRKMQPLARAAERIGRRELDGAVETCNVRQINDVLLAMDDMRRSLKDSLEAQWQAEAAARDQVAALAHDLKTPLTVVRANAEFIAEETEGMDDPGLRDLAAAARDAAAGTERLDAYVRLLIEASRGQAAPHGRGTVSARGLAHALARDGEALAHAAGTRFHMDEGELDGRSLEADEPALVRAVMNVVSNAVDHTGNGGLVRLAVGCAAPAERDNAAAGTPARLRIVVDDDGPGFSAAALAHGCERFFRDDASRTGGSHYGLGLAIARDAVQAHGGELTLSNRMEGGRVAGGRVTILLPTSLAAAGEQ